MQKNFIQATALLIGYIIGVGMFSLPLLVYKAGILSFLILFVVFGFIQYFIHLVYSDIILETKDYHRLPGYVEIYLGKKWKELGMLASFVGSYGALLAYTIITGIFLFQLLNPIFGGSEFFYASAAFFLQSIIVLFGLKVIGKAETIMTIMMVTVIAFIAYKGLGAVSQDNYSVINWKYIFLPYGALLFALDGTGCLPSVIRLVNRDKNLTKKAVRWGTLIPALVFLLFIIVVVGVSGANTTPDSLSGIKNLLGDNVITMALLFGVLAMVTSFLGSAEAIRDTYHWDYKINKYLSWFLTFSLPYLLYCLGVKDLIQVISFAGAVAGGISAIILFAIFWKINKRKKKLIFKKRPGLLVLIPLSVLFVLGVIYEIWAFSSIK